MSQIPTDTQTHHAMLVIWGRFAQSIGFLDEIGRLSLHQKKVDHDPQAKVLGFSLAILAGLRYLQELSGRRVRSSRTRPRPEPGGRTSWADCSGVSRTLAKLNPEEADQIARSRMGSTHRSWRRK